eukprot:CAMPEP_0194213976 /NCGR_PEP_ID=MMETSP0156-20130528/14942_1 /TAXON_ID=33649 /ORGANISM="Thalassionema nitzschioides, Strain L26-B" /LENGTH=122 /DNA_ID=CAMNT_0038942135 /DNA_START=225 /DNA_END=593 /DNA_ORIENTATION=+
MVEPYGRIPPPIAGCMHSCAIACAAVSMENTLVPYSSKKSFCTSCTFVNNANESLKTPLKQTTKSESKREMSLFCDIGAEDNLGVMRRVIPRSGSRQIRHGDECVAAREAYSTWSRRPSGVN